MKLLKKAKRILIRRGAVDLGSGPVLSSLVRLSVPSIAMVLFHTLFNLVDTIFISWLGESHMVAISYTFPVQIGVFAVLEGVGNGVTALVGRRLGEGDRELAQKTATAGLAFSYILCLLWVPFLFPGPSNAFFRMLGATDPVTLRQAWLYNMWIPPMLVLISFLCLFFFYILLINATRTHFEIQRGFSLLPGRSLLTNLKSVLANANIPVLSGIRNSLLVSALSALLSVYFSALTAYGIHAYDFKFKKLAFTFILLIMMMPTQVSALGFVRLITKMGMADTLAPLFLPSIAAPVVFYFMLQYMEGNLPMEIVEAARIDGSGEFSTFNRIVLPILKPALAVQAIFTFVNTWNNYFTPALVLSSSGKKTLPILIAQLRSADFLKFDMGQVYMMVAIAILPVIAVYLCLSKFIVRGVALGGVKG